MVRIPLEYQEVEYLESTGTQYIDLDFGFLPTDEIEIVCSINTSNGSDKFMVAPSVWNNNNNRFGIGGIYNGVYCVGYGYSTTGNTRLLPNTQNDGNIHKWIYSNRSYSIPELELSKDVSGITFVAETKNLKLFYGYNSNAKGKIAYYRHKKADGTEVNFIPCYRKSDNEPGMYDTVSGTFYTNSGSGTFLVGNDVSWDTASLFERRRQILLNTPHIETVSDSVASFNTDISANLKECRVYFSPVQEGSGDPSPDNVRPITGWDGIEITACGKNLLPPISDTTYWQNGYFNSNGVGNTRGDYRQSKYLIPIKAGNYNFTHPSTYRWIGVYVCDKDGNKIYFKETLYQETITIPSDGYAKFYVQVTDGTYMIEKGSIATEYEPYTATTITIPFNRTIYGGYVDLVRGEVVEEWCNFTLDGTNYVMGSANASVNAKNIARAYSYAAGFTQKGLPKFKAHGMRYCNKLPTINTVAVNGIDYNCLQYYNTASTNSQNEYISIMIEKEELVDTSSNLKIAESINEWLSNNPLQVLYNIAEPISYSLTPETIKTLKGVNNIWSNGNGNIEVSYYSH